MRTTATDGNPPLSAKNFKKIPCQGDFLFLFLIFPSTVQSECMPLGAMKTQPVD